MEKKSAFAVILFLTILFAVSYSFALSNDTEEKSFTCLKSQLGDNCGNTQSTQTASFNLLAMAHDSKIQANCKNSLDTKKKTNCWPDISGGSCSIKATSQAVIALKTIGKDADDSVKWLADRKKSGTGLLWYLEIDSANQTECSVNGRSFTILDNKKISGTDPSGLVKSYNEYWFQILDISKNFSISCNKPFVTTLLYQKPNSNTFYISSQTHSASAGDSTNEKVNSYCFSTSEACDYEASLWASLALQKAGEDVSPYIPYLIAMSDENLRYIPSAFLFMLNNADDSYYTALKDSQKEGKYWDESGNRFYDTALVLLALKSISDDSLAASAKEYLLSQREESGCWRSETSFILYSGWSKTPIISGSGSSNCADFPNYKCVSAGECSGIENTLDLYCSGASICCKNVIESLKCSEKQGIICESNQECTGDVVPSGDTNQCCKGFCQDIKKTSNECENQGYSCKSSCTSDEEEKISLTETCPSVQKCCAKKSGSGFSIWWFIIILIILIILLLLAIVFRNKLRIWLFKFKSKLKIKKGPEPISRPTIPLPYRPLPPPRLRQIIPRQQQQPRFVRKPKSEKESEFEETMRKLREMSK